MIEFLFEPVLAEGVEYSQGFLGALIGIGASIFGARSQKKAAKAAGEAQARAAELNAEQVAERARVETILRERKGLREAGSISAATGASGLAGGGSAADILRESARNTVFDRNTIKKQSGLRIEALKSEATAARKGAKLQGRAALAAGAASAASFLL